jgi:NAD(P)-dependent dehydrogenase (short-subunit alcohol dehydrogenase family)
MSSIENQTSEQQTLTSLTSLFDVRSRSVLLTGGARGIGRMIAESLLRAGVKVFLSCRKEEAAARATEELSELGQVHAIGADVSTSEGRSRLIDVVSEYTDHLDGLINNAGATWGAAFDEFPEAAWDKVLGVNVKAPFALAQLAHPLLAAGAARGSGPSRIINIGSIDGLAVPSYENYSYSASKAAIHHLTKHMAANLAPEVLVNAVAPGPFPTKMMNWLLEEKGAEIEEANPLRRVGRADDIGGVIIFLLSRAGEYTTGAVIPVDGGLSTTMSVRLE